MSGKSKMEIEKVLRRRNISTLAVSPEYSPFKGVGGSFVLSSYRAQPYLDSGPSSMCQGNLDNFLGCKCCSVSFIVQIVVAHLCTIVPIGWCVKKNEKLS